MLAEPPEDQPQGLTAESAAEAPECDEVEGEHVMVKRIDTDDYEPPVYGHADYLQGSVLGNNQEADPVDSLGGASSGITGAGEGVSSGLTGADAAHPAEPPKVRQPRPDADGSYLPVGVGVKYMKNGRPYTHDASGTKIDGRPITRPPHWEGKQWSKLTPKRKQEEIAEYMADLALLEPEETKIGRPIAKAAQSSSSSSSVLTAYLTGLCPLGVQALRTQPLSQAEMVTAAAAKSMLFSTDQQADEGTPPSMPFKSSTTEGEHNTKNPTSRASYNALVARILSKREIAASDGARVALKLEWNKLKAQGVWDVTRVKPWSRVANEARSSGKTVHVGRIFEICVEKNCELPLEDLRRKFKGRVVFQGNQVKDENFEAAMFQEMGSAPATMEASKSCDFYSLLPGHRGEQADAESAYTQSRLSSTIATWVRIPRHEWPEDGSWDNIIDPVCPLVLALYGHPDAGGYWEKHCDTHLCECGFEAVPGWRSCYFHSALRLYLIVYVDDFKMSGPSENLQKGWDLIRPKIKMDDPTNFNHFLGCTHVEGVAELDGTGAPVRTMTYDMENFLVACVDLYKELAGPKVVIRFASTPFIDDLHADSSVPLGEYPWLECPWCCSLSDGLLCRRQGGAYHQEAENSFGRLHEGQPGEK